MKDLQSQFEAASVTARELPEKPDNDMLLKLYALYKQATEGDASGEKPGFFDFVGQAKFEAWEQLKGTQSEQAMQQYVDLVTQLDSR